MATWREIKLFCKRNKLVLFCTYVVVIYIVMNVFIAENNVSLLRYQKSRQDEFDGEDEIDNNNNNIAVIEKHKTPSVAKSKLRNNFKDLRFVEGKEKKRRGGVDDNEENSMIDDDVMNVVDVIKPVKKKDGGEKMNEHEKGAEKAADKIEKLSDRFQRDDNNEENEHEKRVKDDNSEKMNEQEQHEKPVMEKDNSRKMSEHEKHVKHVLRHGLRHHDVINKDEISESDHDKKSDQDKQIEDVVNSKRDEEKELKKNTIEENNGINLEKDENHQNADVVGADEEDENDNEKIRDKGEGHDEVKELKHNEREDNDKNIISNALKPKHEDTKHEPSNSVHHSRTEKHSNSREVSGTKYNNKTKDAEQEKKVQGKVVKRPKTPHDVVIAQLEQDKLDSFEIDLTNSKTTAEDIRMPFFVEFGKQGDPGENSTKYEFPEGMLSEAQTRKRDLDSKKNYFDVWVSKKIAIHRSLKDARTKECLKETYNVSSLPSVSIIIVFNNEAWTTLLRSIHSILDRTPRSALLEIILLDDLSTDDDLKTPLEVYIKPLKIIRLIRAKKRLGLIKARNMGFLYATGEIIVFLDSHIECFDGWLEPLVSPIMADHTVVTFPIINIIDKTNFGITILPQNNIGTVNFFDLQFKWRAAKVHKELYYRSPTMPGGLYAISRKWFHHLGAYDRGLKLWGSENLEISFKIWMCGGTILACGCSNVGHVFRSMSPFKSHELYKAIKTNAVRVAEVWLDEYRHLYYEKFSYKVGDYGNVSVQAALRKSLQCKPFDWYLSKIDPVLKASMDLGGNQSGLITNMATAKCLQSGQRSLSVRQCDVMNTAQVWQLTPKGYLSNRKDDILILEFISKHISSNTTTIMYAVKTRDKTRKNREDKALFTYDKLQRLYHRDSKKCLDLDTTGSNNIVLVPCNASRKQMWMLQSRKELQAFHRKKGVAIDWTS